MNVRTERGGPRMDSTPARLNLDTYAARSSIGTQHMRVGDLIREEAQRGVQFASQGTIRIVEEGNELARGASPVEMAVKNQRANFHIETVMEWIPKERADISYEPGSLHMEYPQSTMLM
jgi:hypothetical protein